MLEWRTAIYGIKEDAHQESAASDAPSSRIGRDNAGARNDGLSRLRGFARITGRCASGLGRPRSGYIKPATGGVFSDDNRRLR